ncbi:MAG: ABC-F family ATP-binding cassette domain-containing protein [Propionibacteriaceae bacterium]|nr:ABC-F family ATP-binding cassette domain-containing protein [Propionibacteriaceae bacterium]
MPSLHLSGVSGSFGAHSLFHDLDLTVAPGDVVALVGPNGAGKSTLLRMIANQLPVEAGDIRTVPRDATIGYLPQSVPDVSETIAGYAGRRTGVTQALARYEAAAAALADGAPGSDDEYSAALDRWLALGGADLDVRLAETLTRIGLPIELDRPLGALSGGQAARAAMASVVVSRFDVLLLDEPTNNLDERGLAEMAAFVQGVDAPVLIASHDRHFLDEVATSVLELDIRQQRVNAFAGGWTDYREAKQLQVRQRREQYQRFTNERDALQGFAQRQEQWAGKARAAAHQHAHDPNHIGKIDWTVVNAGIKKQEMRARRARDAIKRLDEPEQLRKEWVLRYHIEEAPAPADVVLTLDEVVAATGSFSVGPVSTHVPAGSRVALVGGNGSGKSTLLRVLLGAAPAGGRISWGARTSIGALDQERSVVSGDRPLLDVVMAAIGTDDYAETRTLLAKFQLGAEHVMRPCSTLSLGERTRAALAVLQIRAANVLVLDEPTNHADVETIEQLQAALEGFGGTILIVTHDRSLVDALHVDTTWTFVRNGTRAQIDINRHWGR